MALSACDLLRGRDGAELIGPREGRFFGGKQLKKESMKDLSRSIKFKCLLVVCNTKDLSLDPSRSSVF